ncbi:hypothetical protein ACP275_14G088600 [Erythranthe tilingii]
MPMAALKTTVTRSLFLSKCRPPSLLLFRRLFFNSSTLSPPCSSPFSAAEISKTPFSFFHPTRTFCTSESPPPKKRNPKLVNFSLPSDSDSDSETTTAAAAAAKQAAKPKLPPPYNPFDKKPAVEEPDDPKNLQEVFAKIREDGLTNSAVKMFDGLSKDGLTHEALELFSQIKDKGHMPDVVAHTTVIEAYVNAGQPKEARKVYLRMLSGGVLPNAYTYAVVVKGLAESGDSKMVKDANRCVGEMVARGIRPNAATVVAVLEGMLAAGLEGEAAETVEILKKNGFLPEESKVREFLKNKRGPLYGNVICVLYGN